MQAAAFGMRLAEVPARGRYLEDSSSVGVRAGFIYGVKTLWVGCRFALHRHGILRSRRFGS
jgi:hypothetical protein